MQHRAGAASGWTRHLDGWPLALVAVCIAGVGSLLVLPRSVEPLELPRPFVAPSTVAALRLADEADADAAEREPLDVDVRALGSAIRAYGPADAEGDEVALESARFRVARAAAQALTHGSEGLRRLRAYQLRSFLREVAAWGGRGTPSQEQLELSGAFHRMVQREGYVDSQGLVLDEAVLRVMFKKRWNELTGVSALPIGLAPEERLLLAAFLVCHPSRPPGASLAVGQGALAASEDRGKLRGLLGRISEIEALDPTYPAALARGVVHERLGQTLLALDDVRRFLEAHEDGPWVMRARNHLRYLWEKAEEESR